MSCFSYAIQKEGQLEGIVSDLSWTTSYDRIPLPHGNQRLRLEVFWRESCADLRT